MDWKTKTGQKWETINASFTKFHEDLHKYSTFLFRGQADYKWKLEPSLLRLAKDSNIPLSHDIIHFAERNTIERFLTSAYVFPEIERYIDGSSIELLPLMQHHGARTRLLDWSYSAYIALYFAVSDCWDKDGCVWTFNADHLIKHINKNYPNKGEIPNSSPNVENFLKHRNDNIYIIEPKVKTGRMLTQQTVFTMAHSTIAEHSKTIIETVPDISAIKFIIPKEEKPSILKNLKAMNITASTLFDTLDGFGKTITEETFMRFKGIYRSLSDNFPPALDQEQIKPSPQAPPE